MVGKPCAACAGSCSNGNLCDVGSNPNRCKDKIMTFAFNGVPYTDCASLITGTQAFGTNYWCSKKEPEYKICQLTCSVCTVSPNVGVSACSLKYTFLSDATHGWRLGTAFIMLLYRFTLCD